MANSLPGGQNIARQTLIDRLLDAVKQASNFCRLFFVFFEYLLEIIGRHLLRYWEVSLIQGCKIFFFSAKYDSVGKLNWQLRRIAGIWRRTIFVLH